MSTRFRRRTQAKTGHPTDAMLDSEIAVALGETPKLTSELRSRAASDQDALVEVVVELVPLGANADSIAERRETFARTAAPVTDAITGAGGEVTGEAWLNQTLRARVPAAALLDLAKLDAVVAVDLPHALTLE